MIRNVCTSKKTLLIVVFTLITVTILTSKSSTRDGDLEVRQALKVLVKHHDRQVQQAPNSSAKDSDRQVLQATRVSMQNGDRQVQQASDPSLINDKQFHERKPEIDPSQKTAGNDYDRWVQKQAERKAAVKTVCEAENIDAEHRGRQVIDRSLLTQLKVDDKHKIIYCYVPKAACTSWKSMFVRLSGHFDPDHPEVFRPKVHDDSFLAKHGLKPLDVYSPSERTKLLQTYSKFVVVRHPYQRLASAFQDKFRVFDWYGKAFQKKYGGQIVRLYREKPSPLSLATGQNATFEEFLRFVGDETVPNHQRIDPHWAPFQELCHPCLIDYDFIAKTETLEEDSNFILDKAFYTPLRLQTLHSIGRTNTSHFDGIPNSIMKNLNKLFGNDLKMFEYEWPLP